MQDALSLQRGRSPETLAVAGPPAPCESDPALLVIAYGNELRTDDGLGPRVGRAIAARGYPGVEVLICHQLTPELAEAISRAGAVLFIDAAVRQLRRLQIQRLAPARSAAAHTHFGRPSSLLALAQRLYTRTPPAWWLTLPASDLSFGETLSPEGEIACAAGMVQFGDFWRTLGSDCHLCTNAG